MSPPLAAFQIATWLGAFLLFHLELLVAKLLLPSFGGSAYVWTTCVMLYQGLLLVGYAAYRWLARRVGVVRYSRWHLLLLCAGLLWLPIGVPEPPSRLLLAHPVVSLLAILLVAIGAPFILLSMTSVLLQSWLSHAPNAHRRPVHILYASSNAGSLIALAAFPLLLEPWCPLDAQRDLWSAGYVLLILLLLWCLPHPRPVPVPSVPGTKGTGRGEIGRRWLAWCLLSAASSAFMLAMTNVLTIELGAVSLFWVLPMIVYLLTWILTFKERPWYPSWLSIIGCAAVVLIACVQTLRPELTLASFRHTTLYLVIFHTLLFWVCMLCHRHLVRTRPARDDALPSFYLWIAVGGWLGSVLISLVVPLLARHASTTSTDWIIAMCLVLVALIASDAAGVVASAQRHTRLWIVGSGLLTVVLAVSGWQVTQGDPHLRYAARNLYGIHRVTDRDGLRILQHGTTIHGQQSLDPTRWDVPLAYYHPHGPLGQVFAQRRHVQRLAAVGLGAGCVAAYLHPGQTWDVYELDPDVVDIAQRYFTYLARSAARPRILIGDARRSLRLATGAPYDLILLDAFSGDAIPTHLLTVEALRLYGRHLGPHGQIALHVSSRHYHLMPVIAATARALGWAGAMRITRPDDVVAGEELTSQWVVLTRRADDVQELRQAGWADLMTADPQRRVRPWTDQRSNVLAALSLRTQR